MTKRPSYLLKIDHYSVKGAETKELEKDSYA